MTEESSSSALLASLNEALDLLADHQPDPDARDDGPEPLASLVEQCAALAGNAPSEAPIRTIHHFACTGGTLICKLISAMPNTVMLSEIDPLSTMMIGDAQNPFFAPTDLIYGARVALRSIDDGVATKMFQAGLAVLYNHTRMAGQHLVVRDHSHSHFCTEVDADERPSLRAMVQEIAPVRSVVTVRHPLDSFLSLDRNGWRNFAPFNLEEYARRYLMFLEKHHGVPIIRYEDLVGAPDLYLAQICRELDLPFAANSEAILPVVAMSGDSGRKSSTIGGRERRPMPQHIVAQLDSCPSLDRLCNLLGYQKISDQASGGTS